MMVQINMNIIAFTKFSFVNYILIAIYQVSWGSVGMRLQEADTQGNLLSGNIF